MTEAKVQHDAAECGAIVEGYDSFWCCCQTKAAKGFNGVTTYARKGLTSWADSAPLRVPELDAEGRAIVTVHDTLAIVNVYVPNDGAGSKRLPFKVAFLEALRECMARLRKQGLRVVLVGDLNIARRAEDVVWKSRSLHMPTLLKAADDAYHGREQPPVGPCTHCAGMGCCCKRCVRHGCFTCSTRPDCNRGQSHGRHLVQCQKGLAEMRAELVRCWPIVTEALATIEVAPLEVKLRNTSTQIKYRIWARRPDGRRVHLCTPFETESRARNVFSMTQRKVAAEEGGREYIVAHGDRLSVKHLTEAMQKIADVQWDDRQQRFLAGFGTTYTSAACADWFKSILDEPSDGGDGMIDVFAHFYPTAQGRFTCFDQYKNKRYENEGARIDYTIIDRDLLPSVRLNTEGATGLVAHPDCINPLCEVCALAAVTSNGRWRPAPYDGTGIVEGRSEDYALQFRAPHTGIVYTPPQYSDHLGVSLCLDMQPRAELQTSGPTRKAQPHVAQKRIRDFFTKKSTTVVSAAGASAVVAPAAQNDSSNSATEDMPITATAEAAHDTAGAPIPLAAAASVAAGRCESREPVAAPDAIVILDSPSPQKTKVPAAMLAPVVRHLPRRSAEALARQREQGKRGPAGRSKGKGGPVGKKTKPSEGQATLATFIKRR